MYTIYQLNYIFVPACAARLSLRYINFQFPFLPFFGFSFVYGILYNKYLPYHDDFGFPLFFLASFRSAGRNNLAFSAFIITLSWGILGV